MYCCKDLKKQVVLSVFEGEVLGFVDKLLFDHKLKKLCALEIISSEGLRLLLPVKNIYKIGKNAITVKNNQMVEVCLEKSIYCAVPIGAKVFSIEGEFKGVVQDVMINEKFSTHKIILDNGQFLDVNMITTIGNNVVIFSNSKQTSKIFSPIKTPKTFKQEISQNVKTLPQAESDKIEKGNTDAVLKNTNVLIGRICKKDIFNFNNELLIKANGVVNKKNLKEINKFNKLRELMLFLK